MDKQTLPFDTSRDVTMAADGMEQAVDDKTLFCTPAPLAASTVSREGTRGPLLVAVDSKGSFLDDFSRLSIQSVSATDLTNQLRELNFSTNSNISQHDKTPKDNSGPDLIQFSGATEPITADDENETLTDVSSRSSMGLIPTDMLSELSASVLPLSTPKMILAKEAKHKEVDSSHSTCKEKTGNSNDWSDNSKQDSKQDSRDMPLGRSHLETVKKRPQSLDRSKEDAPLRMAVQGAASLFAGHLDDVQEGEELDQSLYNVELGDEELRQLDADVDFSDLEEENLSLEEGRESGDEDFDFDEPMLSLPTREREGRMLEAVSNGTAEEQGKTLQAELAEAESRLAEGQETEEGNASAQQTVNSGSDFGLDSRYFRKTPMLFAGDGEDTEVASNRSSISTTNQQRGAAEGEHLLTKLRRQFMSGAGSENEIDTDDELEAARKSLAVAARERGQGADEEDGDRSNLPLPVGLEDDKPSDKGDHGNSRNKQQQPEFSFMTRQSAEGDAAHSPVPWGGGGGGDGSSGCDSDGSGTKVQQQAVRPPFRYVSGADEKRDMPVSLNQSMASNQGAEEQSGLQPLFFLPTSISSVLQDSGISHQALEGSTFRVEDILQSRTGAPLQNKQGEQSQLSASSFNAENSPENPFEDQFAGSFGSFGLGPEEDQGEAAEMTSNKENSETSQIPFQSVSEGKNGLQDGFQLKSSGSFDGPFRKPRLPAPSKKKNDKKETLGSRSEEKLTNLTFPVEDEGESNLEKELRELGIDVGDDDFQTADAAHAMLDADEKQFEEENKFSEHHHLSLAAQGLAWEGEESQFSGFLGGDDNPDHLETSIGTYMARRTETLGSLGEDPRIPRPEFGKPVESPPHRPYPVRLMSPPSTASSILSLDPRTEGEGNEDGDRTMVSADSTLHAEDLKPHKQSLDLQQSTTKTKSVSPASSAEDKAAFKEELSSLLMDLTVGGNDLSMEEALSMSTVFDFIKNHSYAKSSDFASAILKLSKNKKEPESGKSNEKSKLGKKGTSVRKEGQKQEHTHTQSSPPADDARLKGGKSSVSQPVMSNSSSASDSSALTSTRQQASRLPVPVNTGSSPTESRPRKSHSTLTSNTKAPTGGLSKGNSQSLSGLQSHPQINNVNVRHSFDDSVTKVNMNQQSSDQLKPAVSKRIHEQERGKAPSASARSSLSKSATRKDSVQSSGKTLSKTEQRAHDTSKLETAFKEKSNSVHLTKDYAINSQMKPSADSLQTCKGLDADRLADQSKERLAHYITENRERSREHGQYKFSAAEQTRHLQDIPLNIPTIAQKGKHLEGSVIPENYSLQQKSSSKDSMHASTEVRIRRESRKDNSENLASQHVMRTPPQKLPAETNHTAGSAVLDQEALKLMHLEKVSSSETSPAGGKFSHHIPDGMENSASLAGYNRSSHSMLRERAVGTENENWMESRPFDTMTAGNRVLRQQGKALELTTEESKTGASVKTDSVASLSQAQQLQAGRPTLLTGASLLKTEFAQKYLISTDGNRPTAELFTQPADSYSGHPAATRIPPDHLSPVERTPLPPDMQPTSQNSVLNSLHSSRQETQLPTTHFHSANQRPPDAAAQRMDESAMSMYYELNEDLQQTTMLGGESSALGSFWGKSPLYQSTPAFEVGKVAAVSLMGSRLDEQELTTPSTNMVTPRVQRQLIDIQRKIDFPEFCCLGVSLKTYLPVTNRTPFAVVCHFCLVTLLHDNKMIKLDHENPFELKPKMSIGAGASENLPVLFVPSREGEHLCQMEVLTQSLNPTLAPTSSVVQLRAIAEAPRIQISPCEKVLQLGEVMWGGCVSKVIKLRNVKKASLPVRLSIWSANSVWHSFTFDSSDNASDVSIISMSSRPESLGRNVTTVILPGCEDPNSAKTVEICIYCRPPNKDMTRALAQRPADKIEAKINIEVDTPVQNLPPLASVFLQATVGMPRLLISPSHMSLMFKTELNKNIQETIPLNNCGNITMELVLSATSYPECFIVSPSRLTMKPGGRSEVSVIFSPLESGIFKYQSLLLIDVEPEGPSYEIPMEALVDRPTAQPSSALNILSSKSFLSFNGVPLNQTKSLTLRLFNKDSSKAEHACVEVRQSSDCFKLVSTSGEWQQKCEVVIEPKEKVALTVIFCPTAVQGYSGKLLIRKQDGHSSKYSIPLSGYGGRSMLTLSGACQTSSGQRWIELGTLSVGHNIMREVILTNSGVRAAFVKASAFYDMPCQQAVHPGRVAIEPNNFVLASGCSTKVVVAMSPSQREVDLLEDRKEVVAVVRFQHGDEVMRQKYQRACGKDGSGHQHSKHADFRQQFVNEVQDSVVLEGRTIPDSADDVSAFFHHLDSKCVALLAEPHPNREVFPLSVSTVLQAATPAEPASVSTGNRSSRHSSVNREDSRRYDPTGQFLIPSQPESDDGEWTVKPDFLSLTVGESSQKMLQLINFSRQPLSFELSWPPSSVVPEPQKGELKPRSSTAIEVWLHMAWQKRLSDLPWRGQILIRCNKQEKSVRVHIQNSTQPAPSLLALSSPHSSPNSVSSISIRSPRDTTLSSTGRSLQLASTNIHFPKARIGDVHESILELTNISMEPVHWKISAFAPPYVKGADDSNTVKRVGCSVFTVSPTSADLLPQETMKVPVKFCPKTKGTFNQHWEVEYQPLTMGKVTTQAKLTTKFSLTAEVSSWESLSSKSVRSKPTWDPADPDKFPAASIRTPLQEKHPNTGDTGVEHAHSSTQELQLTNQNVVFTDTKVGQVTQVKVELKNSFDHNVEIEVEAPKAPFRIKHKSFKITKRRFLKYPIEFGPSVPGNFADTMVFRALELGKTFTVHLKGTGLRSGAESSQTGKVRH